MVEAQFPVVEADVYECAARQGQTLDQFHPVIHQPAAFGPPAGDKTLRDQGVLGVVGHELLEFGRD